MLAYFSFLQFKTTEVAECTARYNVLRIVIGPAYISYFQNKSLKDAGPITRYYELPNTKDTKSVALINGSVKMMVKKQIDVIQRD